jgi:branched-chain amino acid transport system substrate-binding protein
VSFLPSCKKNSPGDPGKAALESSSQSASSEVIRIGEVGSMTGADATFGISTHQGILLAIQEANATGGVGGKKLQLVTLDDQGKPSEAVLAITKLITQNRVQAVLGEVASTLTIAMAPIAQQYKVPMITPSSINSKVTQQGDYIFRVCFVDQFQSKIMAEFALKNLKAKRAAILRDVKSDYSQDSSEIFKEVFKKGGGEIVADQSYSAGDMDFKSQLTAIRATNPEVIVGAGHYGDMGLVARQKEELGIRAPLLGGDAWDSPKLKEIGGKALDGSYFVSHFAQNSLNPQNQKLIQKYKEAYGVEPDGLAALGYDAALVLIDSLKRAKSSSAADLRDSIASTRDFLGATGKITINSQRNAEKAASVFKLIDGGNRKLETLMEN